MAVAHSHAQPPAAALHFQQRQPLAQPPLITSRSVPAEQQGHQTHHSGWRQNGQWQRQRRTPSIDTGWRSTAFSTRECPKGDAGCGLKNVGALGAGGPLGEAPRPARRTTSSESLTDRPGAAGCSRAGAGGAQRVGGAGAGDTSLHSEKCLLTPPSPPSPSSLTWPLQGAVLRRRVRVPPRGAAPGHRQAPAQGQAAERGGVAGAGRAAVAGMG